MNFTYLGSSEITNDIGLGSSVTVYVSDNYPYGQIGGRSTERLQSTSEEKKKKLSGGAIAGIVIGSVAAVAGAAGCVYFFVFRIRVKIEGSV